MSARLGIIGGYLGSGKSTLVNRLLVGAQLGRTAVVVNDFGSVNVDADLIDAASGDTIELTNGCICCQVSDDAARTMSALAARGDLDHVLCEVSGVGDPGQLASWRDYPGFSAGPVLVCADATAVRRLLRDEYVGDTVARQLGSAEVVLVTKTDLAESVETDEAVLACRDAAPRATLVLQSPERPDRTAIEVLTGATPQGRGLVEEAGPDDEAMRTPAAADRHAATHASETLEVPEAVDVDVLARALEGQSTRLVRAKGVVRGMDGTWHEIQLAGRLVEVHPRGVERPPPAHSALVLIAAGPQASESLAAVRAALSSLLVASTR